MHKVIKNVSDICSGLSDMCHEACAQGYQKCGLRHVQRFIRYEKCDMRTVLSET